MDRGSSVGVRGLTNYGMRIRMVFSVGGSRQLPTGEEAGKPTRKKMGQTLTTYTVCPILVR